MDNPEFDYSEFDQKMRLSEAKVDAIRRNMKKLDALVLDKKLGKTLGKAKSAMLGVASNNFLVNELKVRK